MTKYTIGLLPSLREVEVIAEGFYIDRGTLVLFIETEGDRKPVVAYAAGSWRNIEPGECVWYGGIAEKLTNAIMMEDHVTRIQLKSKVGDLDEMDMGGLDRESLQSLIQETIEKHEGEVE